MKTRKRAPSVAKSILGILVFSLFLAGLLLHLHNAIPSWILGVTSQRYVDILFNDVKITKNIAYGGSAMQRLDVYEPVGDVEAKRAAIVWVHGGGFTTGSKEQFSDSQRGGIASQYTRRGYVSFPINYTLVTEEVTMSSPNAYSAITKAKNDTLAAVQWVRAHATEYRIDPDKIIVAGFSAGAVTALYTAYDVTSPTVAAAVSFSGGMVSTTSINAGDPPAILIHGQQDAIVPLALAAQVNSRLGSVGITHELDTYPTGHNTLEIDDAHLKVRAFLASTLQLSGASSQNPLPTATPTPTQTPGQDTRSTGPDRQTDARRGELTAREQRMLTLVHKYFPRANDAKVLAAFRKGNGALIQYLMTLRSGRGRE